MTDALARLALFTARLLFVASAQPSWDFAITLGGDLTDHGRAVAADGSDGAFACGYFKGTAIFGDMELTSEGKSDAYVLHANGTGAIQWAVKVGGTSEDHAYAIANDGAGGVLVTG